jgi:predicted ATPase
MHDTHTKFIVLSGCSGGGKSALLDELARRGYAVLPEAGRQIIREQSESGGDATPSRDLRKFVTASVARALQQREAAAVLPGPVFCDRAIIDQMAHLEHIHAPIPNTLRHLVAAHPYNRRVFMVPPWPEIFRNDAERTHSFADAQAVYPTLLKTYARLGYECVILPKTSVAERTEFVLRQI